MYNKISTMANKIKREAIKLTIANFREAVIAFTLRLFQANNTKKHNACNSKERNNTIQLFALIDKNIPKVAKLTNKGYS